MAGQTAIVLRFALDADPAQTAFLDHPRATFIIDKYTYIYAKICMRLFKQETLNVPAYGGTDRNSTPFPP